MSPRYWFSIIALLLIWTPSTRATDENKLRESIERANRLLQAHPGSTQLLQERGIAHFMLGDMPKAIADFDRVIERLPRQEAHHWQRGICYYYAGQYANGVRQFELHQTVNPNDVENAVWHFLCKAKQEGLEAARQSIIPIKGDPRTPMKEIWNLFAGKGSVSEVLKAAASLDADSPHGQQSRCYAHLYLGLYYEALGDAPRAAEHIRLAAIDYARDNYMGGVARVHHRLLSQGKPSAAYPEFSWDRLPLYMHIRKATSYTDEEIAFIAKFPLITLEKANGHLDHGSVEQGSLAAARAIKQINPRSIVLYYRNVIVHYGDYAANQKLDTIPNAFLADKSGNQKLVRNSVQAYDLSDPELRQWWVDSCASIVQSPDIDGLFVDGCIKALEPGYLSREIGPEKKALVAEGYHQLMDATRDVLGSDTLILANLIRARFEDAGLEYITPFDGSYMENVFHNVGRVTYEDYVAKGIDAMQRAARQGKIIAFTASLAPSENGSVLGIDEGSAALRSDADARKALAYPLAIFLVCAEKYSYFRAHEGYSANEGDLWMRWFPEYDKPLGPPLGPATRDGYRYHREFQHATVTLDLQQRDASIDWK